MIVFVTRRYNDIDHLVPIVYKIAKDTNKKLLVICQNPYYNIDNDFRLQFLQARYRVKVKHAFNAYTPSLAHKILAKLTCGSYHFQRQNGFSIANLFKYLLSKIYYKFFDRYIFDNLIVNRYFGEQWAHGLLEKVGATIIVFDFAKGRQYITNALFSAAKKLGIITIAVPPGAGMWDLRLLGHKSFESQELPDYDYYMMQHEFRKTVSLQMGVPPEKMVTLGIPRFCNEWQEVLYDITPVTISGEERKPGELRVLYIDRLARHGMDELRLLETIKKVSTLDFARLLIKPHTRSNRLRVTELANYARITPDISSVELRPAGELIMKTN